LQRTEQGKGGPLRKYASTRTPAPQCWLPNALWPLPPKLRRWGWWGVF
jgi:hypothetical protein